MAELVDAPDLFKIKAILENWYPFGYVGSTPTLGVQTLGKFDQKN
jgi:hypothetical protein